MPPSLDSYLGLFGTILGPLPNKCFTLGKNEQLLDKIFTFLSTQAFSSLHLQLITAYSRAY